MTFVSPFNGVRAQDSAEGEEFASLMAPFDKMRDAEAGLQSVKTCKGDSAAAQKTFDDASAALDRPLGRYVLDWSPYTKLVKAGGDKRMLWTEMANKVVSSLREQDKVQHAGICKRATHKRRKQVYSEDDPRFMEGFQPKPQATAPNPYTQQGYDDARPPYYVLPPPPGSYEYGNGQPPKPVVAPTYP